MKVLQLVPKLNVGGVEKGTVEVARDLSLKGHKAVVVSAGGVLEKNLVSAGAKHYKMPIGKKDIVAMIGCYFKLREIIRKEDIDIVHARSRIPALVGYFAARKEKRTFITTAHGQYRKHLVSKVMGWGKIVIVASDVMARHMRETFGVSDEKLVLISRGVDLDDFSFSPHRNNENTPVKIGMICRFTQLKGHLDFLEALAIVSKKLPGIKAVMMGHIGEDNVDYIKKINNSARRLSLAGILELRNSDKDVVGTLRELDIFVSANREQEAFGRSIIEAQAVGVPVVATRVGGVVETINDKKTGLLCEPGNPYDMAEKIIELAVDPGARHGIALQARNSVVENYSVQKMLDSVIDAYEKVLKLKKILVFKISSFGDVILCVPTLRALRERFPTASIKVLVSVKFRQVLENCPYIDEIFVCDFKGRDKGLRIMDLARRLRKEDFDISVDLQNNAKSHILAFLALIRERYGYDNGKYSFLLNRKISLPQKAMSPVKHQANLLKLIGITNIDEHLELWPDEGSEKWADTFLNANWAGNSIKLVGISLSASLKWGTKNWDIGSFLELTDRLARESGMRVIILGSEAEIELSSNFERSTEVDPINAVGRTTISQLISLVKRCSVIVSGDSSPMHIAAALNVPFVALFGPTDPKRHLPAAGSYELIYKDLECSPCYRGRCSKKHKCMKEISTEEVFNAVMELSK